MRHNELKKETEEYLPLCLEECLPGASRVITDESLTEPHTHPTYNPPPKLYASLIKQT